jgi:NitT/TauT family transport system substrate-binding protein
MHRTVFHILFSSIFIFASFSSSNVLSQERPRLRVSTLFIGSSLLPFWIAQDQGHFNRAGVDVELIWMQSNLSTSALLAGEVDVIFGTPQVPLTVMSAKGAPNFVAIAAWASASEHWLVVHPAIRTIKELDGKVLAISRPKSADHGYALIILERNGVDGRRVTFLSTGGQAGRVVAIESGRVMGSVLNRYYALMLARKGFRSIERLERADYPFPPSIFVVARESLQTKRSALRGLLIALIKRRRGRRATRNWA